MASIVIIEGPSQGGHFPLVAAIVSIGRDDECTIQVLDDHISRKHLQLRLNPANNTHIAGDYRSANGVFVNDKPVVVDVTLADGDRIRIGNSTLMYLAADHADSAAAHAAAKKKGQWKVETLLGR